MNQLEGLVRSQAGAGSSPVSGNRSVDHRGAVAPPMALRDFGRAWCKVGVESTYSDLAPRLAALRAEGLSLRDIATRLNEDGHTTRRGKAGGGAGGESAGKGVILTLG
jgi:hypothetical protein